MILTGILLAAGKHVFCEKAMARTLDECKAIYDTYNQSEKYSTFVCNECMTRSISKGCK